MARVAAPLLSLDASGTIGKAITFSKWKGRPYVRTRVIPANPRSGLQTGMRAGITGAPPLWAYMTASKQTAWGAGVGSEAISGFNLMTRVGQVNLRNNYSYCYEYGDQTRATTPAAPGDAAANDDATDMHITWSAVDGALMLLIFHSTSTGFTPGIGNLVAMVLNPTETWTHRNPGLGTHYYDVRSGGVDGGVGALEGEFNGTIT